MPSLVEIDPLVLENKIFLNVVSPFSIFRFNLQLEKGVIIHLSELESALTKFGWNWSNGSGYEDENVKSLKTDDDGQQVIRRANKLFSFYELKQFVYEGVCAQKYHIKFGLQFRFSP